MVNAVLTGSCCLVVQASSRDCVLLVIFFQTSFCASRYSQYCTGRVIIGGFYFFFHCEGGNGDQKRWKPWLGWFQQGQIHLEAKACQEPVRNVTGAVPAFSPHPCSEKDSPQFVRKFWDAVERLWSSQRDAPWCFIGSSWNVRVWLQSLSGEPELLHVSVRNCSGAEQNLALEGDLVQLCSLSL